VKRESNKKAEKHILELLLLLFLLFYFLKFCNINGRIIGSTALFSVAGLGYKVIHMYNPNTQNLSTVLAPYVPVAILLSLLYSTSYLHRPNRKE
jgi:hypothetical protein